MEAGFNAIYYNKLQKFQRSSSELTDSISHKKEQQKQDGPKPKHKEEKLVAALFTFKENPSTNNFEVEDDFEDVLSAMTLDDEKEDVVHFLTTLKNYSSYYLNNDVSKYINHFSDILKLLALFSWPCFWLQ